MWLKSRVGKRDTVLYIFVMKYDIERTLEDELYSLIQDPTTSKQCCQEMLWKTISVER
jgi:hypothetical protein